MWLIEHVEGVVTEQDAVDLMQKMIHERLICHTSGNSK